MNIHFRPKKSVAAEVATVPTRLGGLSCLEGDMNSTSVSHMSPTKQDPSIQHSPDFTTFRVFLQSPRLTQGDTKSKKLLQLGRRKSRATRYTAKTSWLHYYKPQYTLITLRSSVRELYKQLQPRCTYNPQNIREWVTINAFQSCTVRNFILLIQTGDS